MITADISEIFVSFQGEGLYAGQKQVFVRFSGCNLSCAYCDEPAARGRGKLTALAAIKKNIKKTAVYARARAVSFTGGEPLLQHEALEELALYARSLGFKTHLETNGTRCRELAKVVHAIDVVAADIKLPGLAGKALWGEHKKFLSQAPGKTFVKIVVTSRTTPAEFKRGADLAASVCPGMPFFIQPVTPMGILKPPSLAQLAAFYRIAALRLEDVRIVPQMHKLWGIK